MPMMVLSFVGAAASWVTTPMVEEQLPFSYSNPLGPFEMRWGVSGSGKDGVVDLEMTLPSDIGLGFGCTSSAKCDMVVANGGGRNQAFIDDLYESHGDALPNTEWTANNKTQTHAHHHILSNARVRLRLPRP
jgi:hypothetical protein